jgi:hypothetical protein
MHRLGRDSWILEYKKMKIKYYLRHVKGINKARTP